MPPNLLILNVYADLLFYDIGVFHLCSIFIMWYLFPCRNMVKQKKFLPQLCFSSEFQIYYKGWKFSEWLLDSDSYTSTMDELCCWTSLHVCNMKEFLTDSIVMDWTSNISVLNLEIRRVPKGLWKLRVSEKMREDKDAAG